MKHVGVNVAADALFTYVYTGVNGGLVLISADEPGQHSSQNEQDNRNYAKFAKMPMLEPATSQESLDMMKAAFDISEEYDTPVLVRMTTRSCHSKGIVEIGDRVEAINYAVSRLGEGDMLVIAGKGHENGQKIGDRIIPMNDLEEAAKAIARLSR